MNYVNTGIFLSVISLMLAGCVNNGLTKTTTAYKVTEPQVGTVTKVRAFEGQIKAIDPSNRSVTFLQNDGQTVEIKISADNVDLSSLRVGDRAEYELTETDEIIPLHLYRPNKTPVTGFDVNSAMERDSYNAYFHDDVYASAKSQDVIWEQVIDIPGQINTIDASTRMVSINSDDGRKLSVLAGSEIRNLNALRSGDKVVARFTKIGDIKVISTR
jgi:hypothetical protein